MPKTTSLVELILKKWGDDIAGAAKELEEKVGYPESVARRIATGELPMDEASRLERAVEQGYDTSRPVYHGTDTEFLEFDPERAVDSQFWSTTDKGAVESREVGAAGHGVIKEMYHRIQNPAGWEEYDKLLLDEISGRGYDGLKLSDPDGHATMVAFDPKQYKSTDAAFDPQYTGPNIMGNADPRLLAGIAALTGTGMLAPLVVDGKFQHNATKKPKVTKKEKKKDEGMLGELSDALASLSWLSDKRAKLIASILLSDQFEKGMEHSQLPARGIWGTGRLAAGAALGEKPSDTRRAAKRIYTQPTDKTLQEAGQYVLKKTGSPAAAAATSTLGMLTDPTFWL